MKLRSTMKGFAAVAVASLTLAGLSFSAAEARASILPENNLAQQDGLFDNGMTEPQFNAIIDQVIDIWKPLAMGHGAELQVVKDWNDGTVNAYAMEQGNKWIVHMFGGLARRPEVTPDALALVVCHELGHHFGGYAFKSSGTWAATEGEADYFATQVCARRLWITTPRQNIDMSRRNGMAHLQNACDTVWRTEEQRALCYRATEAGLSLSALLGALGGQAKPSIETRDTTEVERTSDYHPAAQCRMDTYFQGALCTTMFDLTSIPGRPQSGPTNNSPEAEIEAGKQSCMQAGNFQVGYRPRCWFKPLVTAGGGDGGRYDDGNNDYGNGYGVLPWNRF